MARFEGYYANAEADAERTRAGWFWSGDLGYRDDEGFFYFAGRTADWLRVDGENFAAAPVERILARFPGVVTAVVLPVPDPRTGDQVMADAGAGRPRTASTPPPSGTSSPTRPTWGRNGRLDSCASPTASRSPAPARSTNVPSDASTGTRPIPCGGGPSRPRGVRRLRPTAA